MSSMDDDEDLPSRQRSSIHTRSYSTEEDYTRKETDQETEEVSVMMKQRADSIERETACVASGSHISRKSRSLSRNLTRLEISGNGDVRESLSNEDTVHLENEVHHSEPQPPAAAQRAITSQKSFQLGKQLSCKWTTGAGPRIGCVRNYPPEIQCRALEHVNLSPRSLEDPRSFFSPRTPTGLSQ